ncbi:type II secretion system protein N [Achromobacter seleniivolatilans]|uniref:Type II secretion system protein N n=1 Tax=Achromobacter seleniivolatilans TaxID=3047478 RepID=A0ABY9M6M8_9BURK|nr:type II secretion system protein N [Achromobacter sp. R39]WMD22686.1 type II secretion system protein N [Achromobacter sp. R39]
MSVFRINKRSAALLTAGVFCAIAAGVCVLPASWLLVMLPGKSPVTLADASGTLWHGSAWVALGPPGAQRVLPQAVQWQWRWDAMALDISHPWLQGPLRARVGWGGLSIPAQSLRVPATVLPALGAPWNTIAPEGMLEISWQALRLGGDLPAGPVADLRWRNASTALSSVAPIGTYLLRVQGTGKPGATLTLSTESGLLTVTGQGSVNARGMNFQGQATYAPAATVADRAALDGLLSTLGRRSDDTVVFGTGK